MFCKYCESLGLDAASNLEIGATHHESFADFVASADNGCELCIRIFENVDNWEPRRDCDYWGNGGIRCFYNINSSFLFWVTGTRKVVARLYICAERGKPKRFPIDLGSRRFQFAVYCDANILTSDDPISEIAQRRPVSGDPRSEGALTQMKSWASVCSSDHSGCHPQSHPRLPTRVTDIGHTNTSPLLFASNGRHGKWVALSYCWGEIVPLRTMSSNLEDFRSNFPLQYCRHSSKTQSVSLGTLVIVTCG